MPGSRPEGFKQGGGAGLQGDYLITGYEWTGDELVYQKGVSGFERIPFKPSKIKLQNGTFKDKFHTLWLMLSVQAEGATESVVEPLFAGDADRYAISDDGLTMWDARYDTPEAEEAAFLEDEASVRSLGKDTKLDAFIKTLCDGGFPSTSLPQYRANYEAIIGWRVKLMQQDDPTMKGKLKKGKDGKDRPYQRTVVDTVLSQPEVKPATPKAGSARPPVSGKVRSKTMPQSDAQISLDLETAAALMDALAQKSPQKVADLSNWVLKNRLKHAQREAIRSRIVNPAFLSSQDGWTYDQAGKTVALAVVQEEIEA